ncbi:uncharacterized protein L969DRAFT_20654, partial [Mixia osmundae IAM 14324]|uniref:uncharacterized protein n=1 Tax=Mixia osmundae (strain CBS 9802 / IAM 14324 / JCM 22182 / KY 12970) TaxID=764103 RepID=UPI0004A554C6
TAAGNVFGNEGTAAGGLANGYAGLEGSAIAAGGENGAIGAAGSYSQGIGAAYVLPVTCPEI